MSFEDNLKDFFDRFFWRQHPEAAIRYNPVVREIKKRKLQDSKILEIGPGSLGVTPYLKRQIDGVDVDFSGPKSPYLNQIKSTAIKLPFRKNSYDVVISVDTLEHLEKDERPKAISEIIRVAKKLAIIIVPVGELSQIQDRELDEYWKKIFKEDNQFLKEHVKNGLPAVEEILVNIDKFKRAHGKTAKISSYPNLNISVRKILMKTWISKNKFIYFLYMKGYLFFLPLLKRLNFGNCYRRVFVIEFDSPVNSHKNQRSSP